MWDVEISLTAAVEAEAEVEAEVQGGRGGDHVEDGVCALGRGEGRGGGLLSVRQFDCCLGKGEAKYAELLGWGEGDGGRRGRRVVSPKGMRMAL